MLLTDNLYIYKILVLEAKDSGKSTFLSGLYKYGEGKDFGDIGILIKSIKTPFNSEESYKLQLWDLKYNSIVNMLYPQFCKGANCALIFFDDSNNDSILEMQNWIETTIKHAGNIPIILVEIRSDLKIMSKSNQTKDNLFETFQLNRLYFKDFSDYSREKLFRQVIRIIENHRKSNRFNVLLSKEFKDFKNFYEIFSIYQTC